MRRSARGRGISTSAGTRIRTTFCVHTQLFHSLILLLNCRPFLRLMDRLFPCPITSLGLDEREYFIDQLTLLQDHACIHMIRL
jgi:hypothetical protein